MGKTNFKSGGLSKTLDPAGVKTNRKLHLPEIGDSTPPSRRASSAITEHIMYEPPKQPRSTRLSGTDTVVPSYKGSASTSRTGTGYRPRGGARAAQGRRVRSASHSSNHLGGTEGFATPITIGMMSPPELDSPLRGGHDDDFAQALDTALARKTTQKSTMTVMDSDIDKIYKEHVAYSQKITRQGHKLQHMEREIMELTDEIKTNRSEAQKPLKNYIKDQKMHKRLETRLEHAASHLSTTTHEAAKLKQKVNGLRMEKMGQRGTHDALQQDLQRKVQELEMLKAETSRMQSLQQQRISEINEAKTKAIEDVRSFKDNFESLRLKVLAEGDPRLNSTLGGISTLLGDTEGLQNFLRQAQSPGKGSSAAHGFGADGEEGAPWAESDDDGSTAAAQSDKKREDEQLSRRRDRLEKELAHVLGATGVKDVEEFVEVMNDAETRHYNWFKIISDLNKEREELEVQKKELCAQMRVASEVEVQREARRGNKKDLELQVTQIRKKIERHEAAYEGEVGVLDNIKEKMLHIFFLLGCGETSNGATLRAQGFHADSALGYLAEIEGRLDTVMQVQAVQLTGAASYAAFGAAREALPAAAAAGAGAGTVTPPRHLPRTQEAFNQTLGLLNLTGAPSALTPARAPSAAARAHAFAVHSTMDSFDFEDRPGGPGAAAGPLTDEGGRDSFFTAGPAERPLDVAELQAQVAQEYAAAAAAAAAAARETAAARSRSRSGTAGGGPRRASTAAAAALGGGALPSTGYQGVVQLQLLSEEGSC